MKNFQDYDEEGQQGYSGLGKKRMTKNQKIYGDFYQAYQEDDKMNMRQEYSPYRSAYNNFKSGSSILTYSAEIQVDIPKKKQKKQNYDQLEDYDNLIIGQFNLKSFLQSYANDLEQIKEEQDQESQPICLSQRIIKKLKLKKLGESSSEDEDNHNIKDITDMTFQQYQNISNTKNTKSKKKVLTQQEKQLQKQYSQGYGKGYKMLQNMGFNLSKGLGKQQTGIQRPVQAVFKTAFTTKDSQLKQDDHKQENQDQKNTQDQAQSLPPEQRLFLFRSKDSKINNFLIDLKNKFESVQSKLYFYQKEVQNYEKDVEINTSLKLQKNRQIIQLQEQIKKLKLVLNNVSGIHSKNRDTSLESIKQMSAQLAIQHKLDLLQIKDLYVQLRNMSFNQILTNFSILIKKNKQFLHSFYLQKQNELLKKYRQNPVGLKSKNNVINLIDDEQIDLTSNKNQQNNKMEQQNDEIIQISNQDKQKISSLLFAVIDHTVIPKLQSFLTTFKHIGQIKNFKIYQIIKIIKSFQNTQEKAKQQSSIDQLIKFQIKPLINSYYNQFNIKQSFNNEKQTQDISMTTVNNNKFLLPHLVLFPLFQILSPQQLQFELLLQKLAKSIWTIQSSTLFQILEPILKFCPLKEASHFLNFYLAPRIMYQLEEFDLTQAKVCKDLLAGFKKYSKFFNTKVKIDILDNTIIPQIVMTYKNYKSNMNSSDLSQWLKRWNKEISKIVPNHLQETLKNDFNIQF